MGRNKFSQREITIISKLLGRKMAGNRKQQNTKNHNTNKGIGFPGKLFL